MGKYGNIDGIATLTNNPNATDNARGTTGKKNGFCGDAIKMEEAGITKLTEDDLVNAIKELFTKKTSPTTYIVVPDVAKALSKLK